MADEGAPQSTLAAQLVDDISTSAKSSSKSTKSEDSSDVRKLLVIIEREKKADGTSKKTKAEQVDHIHMLIYVYCRLALDDIRLDEPFVDRRHVQAELSKAVNFLSKAIKDTPIVLNVVEHAEFSRKREPLYVPVFVPVPVPASAACTLAN
ncbi:hypothetical protein CDD80_5522 [Ophiocordyceps camponoti-rufipedis]|uniref:Uncharacterized protein n=1 Tax=Ophiocordyceps camponoti-rufipedis TaxID=2004952 RepID=A0A2C5ZBA7_9HYPO|nr:hypothetical protein CDD80_5522 [Ophiocordyceps camponoti-rufipedis]